MTLGGIFKKGMVMLQSNSLTFFSTPTGFDLFYFYKKILTILFCNIYGVATVPKLKNILSYHKLNAFNTNTGSNLVGIVLNFVKEFENKIGAVITVPLRLLKNNFHCSNNLPNCQERKELTTNKRQPNIDDYDSSDGDNAFNDYE